MISPLQRAKGLGAVVALSAALPFAAAVGPLNLPVAEPPNILFILLDDLREQGVMNVDGVLPRTKVWLADAGTNFTQGHVTTPLCCPERATIWSGRVPHNHGVVDTHSGDNLDRDWIVPRLLRDAGYRTALVGKFITDWKFRYVPPHFDDYSVFQGGYTDARFWVSDPGASTHHTERAPYSTDYIGERAAEYITRFEADDARPWFMQVAPHAPHNRVEAEKDDCDTADLYDWPARHDHTATPPWQPTLAVTVEGTDRAEKADKVDYVRRASFPTTCGRTTHEGHMKTLLAADEMVDRIMSTLEAEGELANTLVIFTSDNGFSWTERGVTSKGLPYSEHVKVPFLARWDGVFGAGGVDTRPVSGEDLLPTWLDAAGYTPPRLPHPLDGRSFLPGVPGRTEKYLEFGPVGRPSPSGYEAHRGIPTWASLRTPAWQYIEYYEDDNRTVRFREYYDTERDPMQLENLLADPDPVDPAVAPPDVGALSARLQRLWTCAGTGSDQPNPCP